jgi:hypothetical protein
VSALGTEHDFALDDVDDEDDKSAAEYVSRIRARRAEATAAVQSIVASANLAQKNRRVSVGGGEDDEEDESSVVVSGSLSLPLKTRGPKRLFPVLEVRPAHATDKMKSASLSKAVEEFLKKTDHSMDGWEALCKEKKKRVAEQKKAGRGLSLGPGGLVVMEGGGGGVSPGTTTATNTRGVGDGTERRGSDDSTEGIPNLPMDLNAGHGKVFFGVFKFISLKPTTDRTIDSHFIFIPFLRVWFLMNDVRVVMSGLAVQFFFLSLFFFLFFFRGVLRVCFHVLVLCLPKHTSILFLNLHRCPLHVNLTA